MHEPVKANVEDYLAGSDRLPDEFTAHLSACQPCREELAQLKAQAGLLRLLRVNEEIESRPGFYARVIDRIEAQRQSSIWTIFLEPAFGRRLAVASAALAILMGLYLIGSEPVASSVMSHNTAARTITLPGEDEPGLVLGAGQDQDRGAVLVNLATYRSEQ